MVKKAVILCGGMATRFMPICKSIPKEMLPILDKPILQYIIEELSEAGITDILIILGRNKECILNHFDKVPELEERLIKTKKFDILKIVNKPQNLANIHFIKQIEPKGTGYATLKAKKWVGKDNFYLAYGDELMYSKNKNSGVRQLINAFEKVDNSILAVQSCDYKDVDKYGIIKINNEIVEHRKNINKVLDIVEKPKIEDAPSNICYLGPAILTPDIFKELEKLTIKGIELPLTEALKSLALKSKLYAKFINGKRFDCGNVEGFVKANLFYGINQKGVKNEIKNYFMELLRKSKLT